MDIKQVKKAVEKGGSMRGAAKLLKISHTTLRFWLAENGYVIVRRAVLEPRNAEERK